MRSRCLLVIVWQLVAMLVASSADADNAPTKLSLTEAVQLVDEPAGGFASMSPFELQVHYRLMTLLQLHDYEFAAPHAEDWKKCMLDEKRSMYGRLCAAYFLLDKDEDAKSFVKATTESKNLRHRYNAAEVIRLHLASDAGNDWDITALIKLLEDKSLDGSGVRTSPSGEYPLGDRDDIMCTPIDRICWTFSYRLEKRAVPALISVLERRPATTGAAMALGEIGDQRAAPVLMRILKDRTGNQDFEVIALGKLKHKEAVPLLLARLGKPHSTFSGLDIIETEKILEALLAIGDKSAIEPIERYIASDHPAKSRATARRVVVQLKSEDPIAELIALFEKETYEPERAEIMYDLTRISGPRVKRFLEPIARSSDSAFMRRQAMYALSKIGDRESLLVLASLIDANYPENMKADWGWKGKPNFQEFFPQFIEGQLQEVTKQSIGRDRVEWEAWILKNVK